MICFVTNRLLNQERSLAYIIEEAIKAEVDYIILREKDLNTEELLDLALQLKPKFINSKSKFIINGDIEVAKKVKADGIHLSYDKYMKANIDFNVLAGVSVHSLEEAVNAEKKGADYIIYGHIFQTKCKEGLMPRGLENLKILRNNINIPLIAIGGINKENAAAVIEAGADGIALMSSIMEAENVAQYILNIF